MRKPFFFILILIMVQLTACSLSNLATLPVSASPVTHSTKTPNTIPSTIVLTPSPSPIISIKECWNTLPAIPTSVTLPGKLVFTSLGGLSILDFKHNTQRQINGGIKYAGVSPSGEWLSYNYKLEGEKEKLIIESADGNVKTRIPITRGWIMYTGMPWLNNDRLWFSVFPDLSQAQISPIVIIDPFTGEQQEILSNYPGLKRSILSGVNTPGLHFGYSSVVYNPSLQMVIYPEVSKDGLYITLWDRQLKKAIVKIPDIGLFGNLPPLWMPDGNEVVVLTKPDLNSQREWLMINRDGTVRQLTHFHDLYDKFEIGLNASISPDGNYLAFELSQNIDKNSYEPKQLVILNLKTLEVINTCIPTSLSMPGAFPVPVWSPDSQFIAVSSLMSNLNNKTSIAILNVEKKWVINLPEDLETKPVGWLKFP